MTLESGTEITAANRAAWLALRSDPERPFLGASVWGQALGCSPYGTPAQLYLDLIGETPPRPETPLMRRGTYLQPWLLTEYALQSGDGVTPPEAKHEVFFHGPTFHGISTGATLDCVSRERRVIECKSHGWGIRRQYAADDQQGELTDEEQIPAHIYVQVLGQMRLSGIHDARLVVAFDGAPAPRVYTIPFLKRDAETILLRLEEFCWHVARRIPPPPPTAPDDAQLMHRLYLWVEPPAPVELDEEAAGWLRRLHEIQMTRKELNHTLSVVNRDADALKARLLARLQGAARARGAGLEAVYRVVNVAPRMTEGYSYGRLTIREEPQ